MQVRRVCIDETIYSDNVIYVAVNVVGTRHRQQDLDAHLALIHQYAQRHGLIHAAIERMISMIVDLNIGKYDNDTSGNMLNVILRV
jgi:hypothetical protein